MKKLLLSCVVLFALLPQMWAQNYPVYSSSSPPTVGDDCHGYGGIIIQLNNGDQIWCSSVTGKWVRRVASGTGDMSRATYDPDDDGTVQSAEGLQPVSAYSVRYEDKDTDSDGTYDYRLCGDYDGDGTLEITDLKSCIEGFCDLDGDSTPDTVCDLDGDGTNDAACRTVFVLPGTYTGGFRTSIELACSGFTVRGAGPGSTRIVIDAPCEGTDDSLEDNDGNADARHLFYATGTDWNTLEDFFVNAGSETWRWTQSTNTADGSSYIGGRWDCDQDGTTNSADLDDDWCSHKGWCTQDRHGWLHVIGADEDADGTFEDWAEHWTLRNIHVINADLKGLGRFASGTRYVVVDHCFVDGAGEHGITFLGEHEKLVNSTLKHCSAFGAKCVLLGAEHGGDDYVIANNHFYEWGGAGIGSENYFSTSDRGWGNVTITGNVFIAVDPDIDGDGTDDQIVRGGAVQFNIGADEYLNWKRVDVAGNVIRIKGAPYGIAFQAPTGTSYATGGELLIADNVIHLDNSGYGWRGVSTYGIFVDVPDALIQGNNVTIVPDGDGTGRDIGIEAYSNGDNAVIMGNYVKTSGIYSFGIAVSNATDSVVSGNVIDWSGLATATEVEGVRATYSDRAVVKDNVCLGDCASPDGACVTGYHASDIVATGNVGRCCEVTVLYNSDGQGIAAFNGLMHGTSYPFSQGSTGDPSVGLLNWGVDVYRASIDGNAQGIELVPDRDTDGTLQDEEQRLWFDQNARATFHEGSPSLEWRNLWSGQSALFWFGATACGGTKCWVFDVDHDGTADKGVDYCIRAGVAGSDCDGDGAVD